MIELNWGAVTDTGLVRRHNEDSLLAEPPVFAVADGMGGHAAGDVASAMTIDELRRLVGRDDLTRGDVETAVSAANSAVLASSLTTRSMRGMGTTLVGMVLVVDDGCRRWLAFNVGDSRLYRFAGGTLSQVSHDHSEVQEMLDEGAISEEEARVAANRNIVTKAIGTESGADADYFLLDALSGERFLICSDGLTNELEDDALAADLGAGEDASATARLLTEHALRAGGRDNVTVVVVDVLSNDPPDRPDDDEGPQETEVAEVD